MKAKEPDNRSPISATLQPTIPIENMRIKLILLFITGSLLIFLACKKEDNFSSHINFVHASLGFPAVTLKADSANIFTNARYDTVIYSADYPSGTYSLSLSATGVAPISSISNLDAGAVYTNVLYDSANAARWFIRKDNIPVAPGEGRCKVRFFNMIKGSTNLILANKVNVPKDSFNFYTSAGSFGNFASGSTFVELDTLYNPSIRIDTARVVTRLPVLRSGKIYTIFLLGRVSDTVSGLYKPHYIIQTHN